MNSNPIWQELIDYEAERPEFSVYVFYRDGSSHTEDEWRFLMPGPAMELFASLIKRPVTAIGWVERIIITDGGDFTCAEWVKGKGITFPPEAVGKVPK